MKTLYLLRHGKSSWADPGLKDFDRPLNPRGLADVPEMAARFQQRGDAVERITASAAERTHSTAALFAEAVGLPAEAVSCERGLYFVGPGTYLKAVRGFDESCRAAMLVGHNPTITEFANRMAGAHIDYIPTCGLVKLGLGEGPWSAAAWGGAQLLEFDYPKKGRGVA